MPKFYFNVCFIVVVVTGIFSLHARGQLNVTSAVLNISGEVKTPLQLTAGTIDSMDQTTVTAKDRSGKEHVYSGVPLHILLKKAGTTMGEELKGKNLTKYLMIDAKDGYQVVFSLGEVEPGFSQRKIILATRKDGALLPNDEAPFHIIIEGEPRQSRFVRQVVSLKVKYGS